jgi:hypothetical protein
MVRSIFRHIRPVSKLAAPLLLALAGSTGLSSQASIIELDLNSVKTSEPALRFVGGNVQAGGGVGGPGTKVADPISVEMVERDLAGCKKGEALVSIKLSNISQNSLTLPWSPDGARVVVPSGDDPGAEIHFDDLHISVKNSKETTAIGAVALFGNPLIPESRLTLPPGASTLVRNVRIRSRQGNLCGADLIASVTVSTHRARKSDGGYSLISHERWRLQSK